MLTRELKSLRVKNGDTQDTLSKRLGMSKTSYSKRENNKISFTIKEVNKLKEHLELSNEDIIRIFFDD